jgi:hypothetical protein
MGDRGVSGRVGVGARKPGPFLEIKPSDGLRHARGELVAPVFEAGSATKPAP